MDYCVRVSENKQNAAVDMVIWHEPRTTLPLGSAPGGGRSGARPATGSTSPPSCGALVRRLLVGWLSLKNQTAYLGMFTVIFLGEKLLVASHDII